MKTVNFQAFSRPTQIDARANFMLKRITDTIEFMVKSGNVTPEEALILYQECYENIDWYVEEFEKEMVA